MTSHAERMTERLRCGTGRAYESLREALVQLGVDPATSALVDFCQESAPMEEAGSEAHHVVVVTAADKAFVGWLRIDPVGCRFDRWFEVPTRLIANRDELVRRLSENRRAKRAWNDGIPSWVCRPQDILYNGLIQEGRDLLKREGHTH